MVKFIIRWVVLISVMFVVFFGGMMIETELNLKLLISCSNKLTQPAPDVLELQLYYSKQDVNLPMAVDYIEARILECMYYAH